MKNTQFSVLMSVYFRERADYLAMSLLSITANQLLMPTEIILVKDGPLTSELDAVFDDYEKRYPDIIKVIALPENVGLGNALNEGLKHCSHELVARMDSDDICVNNRFEQQLLIFQENPNVTIVGGWISEFSENIENIEGSRILPKSHDELVEYAKSQCPFNHMTVMFKKQDILEVGGYQHLYLLEDYWLWIRLILANKKLHNIQSSLVYARGGVAMTARRGGIAYMKSELWLQYKMYKLEFISIFTCIKNCIIRATIRIMPNKLRTYIYKTFLRK